MSSGNTDDKKGFDFLLKSLNKIDNIENCHLVVLEKLHESQEEFKNKLYGIYQIL